MTRAIWQRRKGKHRTYTQLSSVQSTVFIPKGQFTKKQTEQTSTAAVRHNINMSFGQISWLLTGAQAINNTFYAKNTERRGDNGTRWKITIARNLIGHGETAHTIKEKQAILTKQKHNWVHLWINDNISVFGRDNNRCTNYVKQFF